MPVREYPEIVRGNREHVWAIYIEGSTAMVIPRLPALILVMGLGFHSS